MNKGQLKKKTIYIYIYIYIYIKTPKNNIYNIKQKNHYNTPPPAKKKSVYIYFYL